MRVFLSLLILYCQLRQFCTQDPQQWLRFTRIIGRLEEAIGYLRGNPHD